MFCDLTEQHLEGEIVTSDPLSYIEGKLSTAYTLAKKIENANT